MAEPTKPYNVDNPAHVRSRKKQAERDTMRELEAYRYVLSDPRGRMVINSIIIGAGFYESAWAGSSRTDYNCGRQSIAHGLIDLLEEQFPKELLLMEQEHLQSKIEAKVKDEANRTNGNNTEGVEE